MIDNARHDDSVVLAIAGRGTITRWALVGAAPCTIVIPTPLQLRHYPRKLSTTECETDDMTWHSDTASRTVGWNQGFTAPPARRARTTHVHYESRIRPPPRSSPPRPPSCVRTCTCIGACGAPVVVDTRLGLFLPWCPVMCVGGLCSRLRVSFWRTAVKYKPALFAW